MVRFDPQIEVLCDDCARQKHWQPEYVYHDWSGKSGQYDTSDSAFVKWMDGEGWGKSGDHDLCEDCLDAQEGSA